MKKEEIDPFLIDAALSDAAHRSLPVDVGNDAIERVKKALLRDLRPVRPLAPPWAITLGLLALFIAIGLVSAVVFGLHGIRVLSRAQAALIFLTLLVTAWLAAVACARQMRPAAGRRLGALSLVLAAGLFPPLFSLLFRGYGAAGLVHEGLPCLVAGLVVAIPTGLVIALLLRRGFVMDWGAAGIAAGALAGLTGLAMLELHCPNLKAIHVMVWHVAVVVVSGILGFVVGWNVDRIRCAKGAAS